MRKEIVAFIVLTCLLMSVQTVFADTTSSAPQINGPFKGGGPAPSQFVLDFIHMTEAHVTLSSAGIYTFEETMASTPSGWMASWQPSFAPPHDKIQIFMVIYEWSVWTASGKLLGVVEVYWYQGTTYSNVFTCINANYPACLESRVSPGSQIENLASLTTPTFDNVNHIVSITISESDLASALTGTTTMPTGAQWRCSSHLYIGSLSGFANNGGTSGYIQGSDIYYVTAKTNLPT